MSSTVSNPKTEEKITKRTHFARLKGTRNITIFIYLSKNS